MSDMLEGAMQERNALEIKLDKIQQWKMIVSQGLPDLIDLDQLQKILDE